MLLPAMKGTRICDPDSTSAAEKRWTELENVRLYHDFFEKSREILKQKRSTEIVLYPKGQFSKIRHISKEVCRILNLCPQMQCLSGKLISHRRTKRLPCVKGAPDGVG